MQVSTTTTADPLYMYNNMNKIFLNPFVFIIILLVILGYILFFVSLGNNSTTTGDSSGKVHKTFGVIIIGILIVLVLLNALQYFFSINVTAIFKNFMTEKPEIDLVIKEPPPNPDSLYSEIKEYQKEKKEQVFNIPGNYYNYENAKALCTAYGANLATYEQIEDSYQNGGEWCNYGWSDGQMALFPTQQSTFNTLQDKPGHEHDCGRPGINGGYIANPNVRFGVNCYGTKPAITQEEETLMDTTPQYPESAEDIAFQKRVDFWKSNINNILISPFNQGNWNFTN
jgi:hypothetical protein